MKIVIGILTVMALMGWFGSIMWEQGKTEGVKSVPTEDCTAEVQVAEQGAYGAGVTDTVKQVQAYILDSCTSLKELTVAGETFVCLKKQEM